MGTWAGYRAWAGSSAANENASFIFRFQVHSTSGLAKNEGHSFSYSLALTGERDLIRARPLCGRHYTSSSSKFPSEKTAAKFAF